MLPEVIIHNSISLDGSLTNFEPNLELHYKIAGNFKPDAHLIGSNTVKAGITLYGNEVPFEKEEDFVKQKRNQKLPCWVIPDTKGRLIGLLHTCRRFEFCKDVIVLVSKRTPNEYLDYLKQRNYDFHIVGETHVDIRKALELLFDKYKASKVLVDTGRILSNLLLNNDLVSEISLLVHPIIVGKSSYSIFSGIDREISLRLFKRKTFLNNYLWLIYKIAKTKENSRK